MNLLEQWYHWFPVAPTRDVVAHQLAEFYTKSTEYHNMTSGGDKTKDPQVVLLSSLLMPGGKYAEVGCGGGAVCRLVGDVGNVVGMDISELALQGARKLCAGTRGCVQFINTSADNLPLPDGAFDGVYSFEVIEHVWEPERMISEMVRIAKPGGFILLSTPNQFSLDLHLPTRISVGCVKLILALIRRMYDLTSGKTFCHVPPDFDHGIYPDCDMITATVPSNFAKLIDTLGCDVEFWDTTYMCAHRLGSRTTLEFQRNAGKPFLRHFGDHFLMLARKR